MYIALDSASYLLVEYPERVDKFEVHVSEMGNECKRDEPNLKR